MASTPATAEPHAPPDVENGDTATSKLKLSRTKSLQDQTSRLPFKQLMVVFVGLQVALFVSFLDQTSVSTATPVLAEALGAGAAISWVGTSFLVATTSFQMIYSRLSDIFGRKQVMLSALTIFMLGNLLSGFSKTSTWLFITRGIAGMGAGGINSLVMIIISDVVSLQQRGKYQGFTGFAIALGSGVGPLIGGALSTSSSWRWCFWFTAPLTLASALQIAFTLPLTHVEGSYLSKLRKVDFGGCVLVLAATTVFLVPISGGGSTYAWDSPLAISMITIGGVLAAAFLLYEWKIAKLPILPIRLFKNRVAAIVFVQTFLTGIVYYGNLFYLPLYFQNVLGMSATTSGVFILPLILIQTLSSTLVGQITSRTGRMIPQITAGYCIWTIGSGLQTTFSSSSSHGYLTGLLILQGIGVGGTLQSSLVAAQCAVSKKDRAVVTGARNFFRTLGGAVGLTVANAILGNVLTRELRKIEGVDVALGELVVDYGLTKIAGTVGVELEARLREAYMRAVRDVFYMFVPVVGLGAVVCAGYPDVRTGMEDTEGGGGGGGGESVEAAGSDMGTPDQDHSGEEEKEAGSTEDEPEDRSNDGNATLASAADEKHQL